MLVEPGACERYAEPILAAEEDPAVVACACERFLAEYTPKQREVVRVTAPESTPDKLTTAAGLVVRAEVRGGFADEVSVAWFMPGQIRAHVPQCFVGRGAPVKHEVKATIEFGRDGRATKATLGDIDGLLEANERECVLTELNKLVTPCPRGATAIAIASIDWEITASEDR
jgi:hypothetical protein